MPEGVFYQDLEINLSKNELVLEMLEQVKDRNNEAYYNRINEDYYNWYSNQCSSREVSITW